MRYYIFLLPIVLNISCVEKINKIDNETNTGSVYTEKFSDKEKMNEIKNNLFNEDSLKYKELRSYYFLSGNKKDFLYYSMTYAIYKNSAEAYYDTFILLDDHGQSEIGYFAYYFLLKAHEADYEKATIRVNAIFGKKIPKSEEYIMIDDVSIQD